MTIVGCAGAFLVGVVRKAIEVLWSFGPTRLFVAGALLSIMVGGLRAVIVSLRVRRGDPLARAGFFDPLTGLHNRAALKVLGARMVQRAHSGEVPLHFLLIVVDGLRELEMKCGPRVRDGAICAVSEVLKTCNSGETSLARLRSGEFGIFLLGQQAQEATATAERLQAEVKGLRLEFAGQKVSVSLCVAQMRPEDKSWAEMLCRADVGLMCARSLGPNQMVREAAGAPATTADAASWAAPTPPVFRR